MTEKVYKWNCHFGRMGDLEGLFVATESGVAAAIGKRAYFGEVLGKHSEVYGDLEASEFTVLSEEKSVVEFVREHGPFGFNPLAYVKTPCDNCGEGMSTDEVQTYWCHDCDYHVCYSCGEVEHSDCQPLVKYENRAQPPQVDA